MVTSLSVPLYCGDDEVEHEGEDGGVLVLRGVEDEGRDRQSTG